MIKIKPERLPFEIICEAESLYDLPENLAERRALVNSIFRQTGYISNTLYLAISNSISKMSLIMAGRL